MNTPESTAPEMASTRWQRLADRLARYGWLILLLAVAIALLGGVMAAALWQPVENVEEMSGPGLQDIPMIISMLGYLLVILLGVPGLFAGLWDFLRGRWAVGGRRLLPFVGPVLFLVGTEILPHLLNPCSIPYELGSRNLPGICQSDPAWGADLASRWHLLDHTLVGAIPMTTLYWLALRRWRPDVTRSR